jgi:hypothetical protein
LVKRRKTLEESMNAKLIPLAVAGALAAVASAAASAQDTYTYRDNYTYPMAHAPGWNVAAADGMCRLRIWVDDRARVQLHGDQIVVDTNSGKRSFDQGSVCTQPLPAGEVNDFRVTTERGRGQVVEVRPPERRNNYTTAMTVVDPQNGGDTYEIVVSWHNPGTPLAAAPVAPLAAAPVYAPAPAYVPDAQTEHCYERVRGQFIGRNGDTGAFMDFTGTPSRERVNGTVEVLRGEAWAGNRYEARQVTYACEFNIGSSAVQSANYDLHGPARRRYSALD